MKLLKNLYLNNLFFYLLLGNIVLFVVAFFFPRMYKLSWVAFLVLMLFLVIDILILFFAKKGIEATRITAEKLSNGDENAINISIKNYYTFPVVAKIIDEIPFQFQVRNFNISRKIKASSQDEISYYLRPTERGEYYFGNLNVYISSPLLLSSRRFSFDKNQMVPVYPSYIQLRKYDLMAFPTHFFNTDLRKFAGLVIPWNLSKSRNTFPETTSEP